MAFKGKELRTGDVIKLPIGMGCYHNQDEKAVRLDTAVEAVVEVTRRVVPLTKVGADAHFEECLLIKARVLNCDGTYHPEGALLTFAQYGDFREEFILPDKPNLVLRRMKRHFVAID